MEHALVGALARPTTASKLKELEVPMRTKNYLTSDDVTKMLAAARSEAIKNKWKVTIAIVDDAGVLLSLERLDGARPLTVEVATGKARTAALMAQPTKVWEERIKDQPNYLKFPLPLPMQGGLPIIYQGECVGGVGAAGVKAEFDEQIAAVAIAALMSSLS